LSQLYVTKSKKYSHKKTSVHNYSEAKTQKQTLNSFCDTILSLTNYKCFIEILSGWRPLYFTPDQIW
jgi:hypothetical protein